MTSCKIESPIHSNTNIHTQTHIQTFWPFFTHTWGVRSWAKTMLCPPITFPPQSSIKLEFPLSEKKMIPTQLSGVAAIIYIVTYCDNKQSKCNNRYSKVSKTLWSIKFVCRPFSRHGFAL